MSVTKKQSFEYGLINKQITWSLQKVRFVMINKNKKTRAGGRVKE